jgi:1-aminocyclopropane-1-carboxylate deaminase/D-cysteine desulfhydrase-like pyridoxal-dependent ACC family enzyme
MVLTMKCNMSASFLAFFATATRRRRYNANTLQSLIHRFNSGDTSSSSSSSSSNHRSNKNLDELMDQVLNNPNIIVTSSSSLNEDDDSQEDSGSSGGGCRQNMFTSRRNASQKSTRSGWMRIDWARMSTEGKNRTLEDSSQTNQIRQVQQQQNAAASPVELAIVRGRLVHVKRDDQLRLPGSQISGNKARKMWSLNALPYDNFPDVVVSYGGPQSNAMLALAAVVHFQNSNRNIIDRHKSSSRSSSRRPNDDDNSNGSAENEHKKRFVYYTKKLPHFLRKQPRGNLFRAQSLGMELVELSAQEYNDLFGGDWGGNAGEEAPPIGLDPPLPLDNNSNKKALWIPQGAACAVAIEGTRRLANEITSYWRSVGNGRPLSVCIPGGTCSCAVLLHHAIQQEVQKSAQTIKQGQQDEEHVLDIQVVVIPCVGDDAYARRQMMSLNAQLNRNIQDIPTILAPTPDNNSYFGQSSLGGQRNRYFIFGEPEAELLETFRSMMDEYQIVLDLLYGAPSWTIMLRHWRVETKNRSHGKSSRVETATTSLDRDDDDDAQEEHLFDPQAPLAGREIMYVHTGGLEGINSQLLRYKYKGLVDNVQLPGRSGG